MTPPTSASLFDADPDQNFSLVEVLAHSKPATKAQQTFQRLVVKIELKREQLKQWQAYLSRYNQRLVAEMEPLRLQLRAGQRQMVLLIDELLNQPAPGRRLGHVQRAKLRQLLMKILTGLLGEGDDAELETLHDRYSDISHEQIRQSQLDLTQTMLQDVFGLEVGDDHGAASTEELLQHAQRKMRERAQAAARLMEEQQTDRAAKRSKASAAKAEAAQAKREQAAKEVSQSLREVFRKLVSALHPDREPDADARQRKTLLMQRVNQAYDANDLLTLLGLQLEIEQIDAAHLASVSPQRLAHYNQILREQLVELESELEHYIQPFRHNIGERWGAALTPAGVDQHLNADIAHLRATIRDLQKDLAAFRDPNKIGSLLKHYELEPDDDDMNDLTNLMDFFQAPAPTRRGKKRR